jgi:hypothetical protein
MTCNATESPGGKLRRRQKPDPTQARADVAFNTNGSQIQKGSGAYFGSRFRGTNRLSLHEGFFGQSPGIGSDLGGDEDATHFFPG